MMNKKGDEGTGLWVKISVAVLIIVLLFVAIPHMFSQGFSSINNKFCLNVDTDNDGVVDAIELSEGHCVCNEDIPSQQFYVIDKKAFVGRTQTLFTSLPTKISLEDVQRITKYIYEKQACNAQGGTCTSSPVLVFKDQNLQKLLTKQSPALNNFCYSKTGDCTINDFMDDFLVKDSKYTSKVECAIPNKSPACEALRKQRCEEEKTKAENEDKKT